MRDTIRARFTLIFGALMIAVLVSIWAVNNWWLESYYMNEKIRILETATRRSTTLSCGPGRMI